MKKKADLEQLLNTIIEKGWKPFGDEKITGFQVIYVTGTIRNIVAKRGRGQINLHYSIRDVTSKSSGLWQFVCENGMVKANFKEKYFDGTFKYARSKYEDGNNGPLCECNDYEYRIIESALKDESELESFLLENIKMD